MKSYTPVFVGSPITINAIRGFILDEKLTESDTVLLHPDDAELIQREFKTTYSESIPDYYFLLGVFVETDTTHQVPRDRLVALCNDDRSHRLTLADARALPEHAERNLYRCGWCGTHTDAAGHLIDGAKLDSQNGAV